MNILVVEDMKLIRKGIIKMIEDIDGKVEKISEACNGVEALELIKKEAPDLIITDIRMPEKNGLQLIEEARIILPQAEFIIITGHAEFEYAKKAIEMGVNGFVLKPINEDNFNEVFYRAITELEKKRSYSLLKKDQTANIINKIFLDERSQGVSLEERAYYILILIHFEDKIDKETINNALASLIKGELTKIRYKLVENYTHQREYFLLLYSERQKVLEIQSKKIGEEIYDNLNKEVSVSLSMSLIKKSVTSQLYKETKEALLYKFFGSQQKIYAFNDNTDKIKFDQIKEKVKILQYNMEKRNLDKTICLVRELFSKEMFSQGCSPNDLTVLFSLITDSILNAFNIDSNRINQETLLQPKKVLSRCKNIEELKEVFIILIEELMLEEKTSQINDNTVEKIKVYIQRNYLKDLQAKEIAQYFNISSSYLSTIFKKYTGMKLSHYIIDIRMKQACYLLDTTNLSIKDISKNIGYCDVQYFYRIFKKWSGLTPLGYRNRNLSKKSPIN